MLITNLKKHPHLFNKTLKLIEQSFHYPENQSFKTDFHPLMNVNNHQNCWIIIDSQEEVVAHIGVQFRNLQILDNLFPIMLLGGIATLESERGKGHIKRLFDHVIKINEDQCCLYILWSNLTELYNKFGFHQGGGQIEFPVKPLSSSKGMQLSELSTSEFDQVKKIYLKFNQCRTTIARTNDDWNAIKNISSTSIYLIKNETKEIIGYCLKNKGFDLEDIIHECCYYSLELEQVLQQLPMGKLWLPEQEKINFPQHTLMSIALLKIGHSQLFSNFIHSFSNGKIVITNINQLSVDFEYNDEMFNLTIGEFFSSLFGPNPVAEFSKFSFPLFIYGVDSI